MEEDEKPVKEVVPTEPEETKPTPETPPVVTPPETANDSLREAVTALSAKVEELSGIVTGIIATGSGEQDSNPAGRPWTHWGKGKK